MSSRQNKDQQTNEAFENDSRPSSASITTPTNATPNNSNFKISTFNRRHLDFDPEYNLADVNAANRSRWQGSWCFIQAADTQFGMIDSFVKKKTEPGWQEELALSEALVGVIGHLQPKPKFIVICGDLVDALPNKPDLKKQQISDFKRIFSRLNIPMVCVCGNHDIGNEPTPETVQSYVKDFGDDYFYFTTNDVLFIVINSQFYENRDFIEQYAKDQDEWLESMLDKCKLFKYSIIFEHIPWFLEHPDEDDQYFNIKRNVRLSWLRKFKDAGVTKIMCGHYHRNAGGWFEGMELVVTSAIGAQCGNDKSGVRIVKMLDYSIEHKYFSIEELEQHGKDWLNKSSTQ